MNKDASGFSAELIAAVPVLIELFNTDKDDVVVTGLCARRGKALEVPESEVEVSTTGMILEEETLGCKRTSCTVLVVTVSVFIEVVKIDIEDPWPETDMSTGETDIESSVESLACMEEAGVDCREFEESKDPDAQLCCEEGPCCACLQEAK